MTQCILKETNKTQKNY